MAQSEYSGLTVTVKRTPEGGHYVAGVEVEGAWFGLGAIPVGEVEARLGEAAQSQQEKQRAEQEAAAQQPRSVEEEQQAANVPAQAQIEQQQQQQG